MDQKKDQCLILGICKFDPENIITMVRHNSIEVNKIKISGVQDHQAM